MNTRMAKAALIFTATLILGLDPIAYATQADSEDTLGEVIVTARRVEERLQDVPISITVYTPQQIANRNIVSSVDLATYTPSLTVNTRFGPEKAAFALRGFSQEPLTAPSVAVYFADVVAPRMQANTASGNGAGVGSLMDLQNIQVLKGPQGTLFGRNTTGGAILIVPQKPTDKFEGYIDQTFGNYDAHRTQVVVNVPFSASFRTRLAIDRNTRDGDLNNRYDLGGVGPANFNNLNYFALRLSAVADLTPNLENYTIYTLSDSHTNNTLGRVAVCNHTTTGPGGTIPIRAAECAGLDARIVANADYYDVTNSTPYPYEKFRQWQFLNTTAWKASDTLTLKNIFSYGRAREAVSGNIEGDVVATPFVTFYPGIEGPQGNQETYIEELQLQGRTADHRLTWQAGGYLEISNPIGQQSQWTSLYGSCTNIYSYQCTVVPGAGVLPTTLSTGSVTVARNNYNFRNHGIYAQSTFKFSDKLSLTAGARYTWDTESSISHNYTVKALGGGNSVLNGLISPSQISCTAPAVTPADPSIRMALATNGSCALAYEVKSSKPTWVIDLDYKPNDDLMLYGKYARGYRAGGINPSVIGAAIWLPEQIDTYEVGIKTTWNGVIRGTVDVSAFYNDFTNQQVTVTVPACIPATTPACTAPAPVGINGIQNAGKSKIKGLELDSSLELFKGFRLDVAYAYLDAKITAVGLTSGCDNTAYNCAATAGPTVGTALTLSPKSRVTLTGTYTLPLDEDIGKISLGATYTHTDVQRYSYADQAAFNNGVIPFDPTEIPAVGLLNLNVNWNSVAGKPIDLALFATNVADTQYRVAATNALTSVGADFILLGQRRMFGVRLKYRFGD